MVNSSYLFLLLIPYAAASITFNFTKFGPENRGDIETAGDASISEEDGLLRVTPLLIVDVTDNTGKTGRATYVKPFHLWDKSSGELADFTTDFSFKIDSNNPGGYADGFTFFLAQKEEQDVTMEQNGGLGLPFHKTDGQTNSFVAVEFDTFGFNEVDPKNLSCDHVGVDINYLSSVVAKEWYSDISGGKVCHAWITYDSVSKNLSVSFTGFQNDTVVRQHLHYEIDLTTYLPEWVIFGFSAATGDKFQNNTVMSWAFNSSDLQIDDQKKEKNTTPRLVMRLTVGISLPITFFVVLAICVFRKKKKTREEEEEDNEFDVGMNNEFEMGTGPRKFSYRELARSTNDFADDKKLGQGGFGGVYRGFLNEINTHIAVKRVSKSSRQGIKEYASEVKIISRLRHRNLVQLIGWCHEKGDLLLVYEFMENGSLDLHLFKSKSLLAWETRYTIAHGLASALLYLHEEWEQCVLHRDVKSSNVMLDSHFNAKLGDFGLAKLVDHEKGSQTTILAGTLGYMAPESVVTGKATRESDVFSFGVVALEIACGRKTIEHKAQEKQIRLVQWVWELYGTETLLEAVDPRLGLDYDEEEIKRLMILGLWCVHPDSDFRPSMRQAVQVLNSEASLPILPSKMPVASYLSSPMSSSYGDSSIIQTQSSSSSFYIGRT